MGKTFSWQSAPDRTCQHCGAVYAVRIFNAPEKDNDSFICSCGVLLHEWRSTSVPEYTRKE